MTHVWTIARQTISEGVRMKIALVFFAVIGLAVLGLPFSIKGDASLTGAVQSFLSYGLTTTGVLLGLLTILMSRSLSDELVHRQLFLVVSKPIPRWQYILGKWLGMVLLSGTFLAFAGAAMYGMVHYIKRTHPPIDDRYDAAELAHEVLVARHALTPNLPDFAKYADREFQQNLEGGLYANIPDFDPKDERRRLLRKYEAQWRVVGPLEARVFQFENVLCDRSPEKEIQIRYKAEVSRYAFDEVFRALWIAGDAQKGARVIEQPVRHVVGRYHTVHFPADVVAADHTLKVEFHNVNPFVDEPQFGNIMEFRSSDEVEVLLVVGSFEGNLARLLVMMCCKLMFLAAVALLTATVFSFPVASFASFTVYVLAGAHGFLSEALELSMDSTATMFSSVKEFLVRTAIYGYDALRWIIPDFGYYDGVETLVNGRNVGLVWTAQAVTDLVLLKATIVLGLAMLLFHRREVAEVSV